MQLKLVSCLHFPRFSHPRSTVRQNFMVNGERTEKHSSCKRQTMKVFMKFFFDFMSSLSPLLFGLTFLCTRGFKLHTAHKKYNFIISPSHAQIAIGNIMEVRNEINLFSLSIRWPGSGLQYKSAVWTLERKGIYDYNAIPFSYAKTRKILRSFKSHLVRDFSRWRTFGGLLMVQGVENIKNLWLKIFISLKRFLSKFKGSKI
jgi:hypothetical protein